jgi:serine/threonine protein kinase/tetratricopeptide (TPR) repeat protein
METTVDNDLRVIELVSKARLQRPVDREAWLSAACEGDSQLYEEVAEMVSGEEEMGLFLLSPMIAFAEFPQPFKAGQIVNERFEIRREIGEGGMGVVYEAFDKKRNLRIAIKSAKPGFERLLSPELEGALTVRHPNVCRVNEIHIAHTECGDVDFLTMELLEGETLAQRLKARGKFPQKQALEIGRQLCMGLAEAHRSGVIHRDLKTANVILCPSERGGPRAIITDFGLSAGAGKAGEFAGTLGYMSPELLLGGSASKASDIYALGATLYQIAAGRPLVSGASPPGPQDFRGLAPRWSRTIARCLDPSPQKRPGSALEVLAGLEGRPKRWLSLLALPLLIGLSLTSAQLRTRVHDFIWTPPNVRLAVLPGVAADTKDAIAGGVLQDVASRLSHLKSGSRQVDVISPTQAKELLIQTPQQAFHSGATYVLQTNMFRQGDQVVVQGAVIDAKTGAHLRDLSRSYGQENLGAIPAALTGEVTATLNLTGVANEVLAVWATAPYDRGLYLLQQDSRSDEEAIRHFEEAAHLDPSSPLPLAGLVEAEIKSFDDTKDGSHLTHASQDLQRAANLNPDSARVHLAAGLLDEATSQYEKAREQYLRVRELEPRNMDAFVRLSAVYSKLDMPEQALATYQEAIRVNPESYQPYKDLGVFYYSHGQYAEAVEQFKKATEKAPGMYRAYMNLGASLEMLTRYKESEQALSTSLKLQETPGGLNNMGTLLTTQMRDAEAVPYYERAVALNPHEYVYWMNLADSNRRLGHLRTANSAYRRARDLAFAELGENPRLGSSRAFAAYFEARLGERRNSESEIKQSLQLSPGDGRVIYRAVLTYEAMGMRSKALSVLATAPPQVLREFEKDSDLANFCRDSRYKKLVAANYQRR